MSFSLYKKKALLKVKSEIDVEVIWTKVKIFAAENYINEIHLNMHLRKTYLIQYLSKIFP